MQEVFETLFDIVYLSTVITLGYRMIRGGKGQKQYLLFGIMAVVLGCGDAFHLIPRAVALCTTGLESYPAALGVIVLRRRVGGRLDAVEKGVKKPLGGIDLGGHGTGSPAGPG